MHDYINAQAYHHLQDEASRQIYLRRCLYSLTGEKQYITEIVERYTPHGEYLKERSRDGKPVYIFGAGGMGRMLLSMPESINWTAFADNNPVLYSSNIQELPIIAPTDIPRDAYIVIAMSGERCLSVEKQCLEMGFPQAQIFNYGKWLEGQYFDLPELYHSEHEVFVDCGPFNGNTTISFIRWSGGFERIYAFEPDRNSYEICRETYNAYCERNLDIDSDRIVLYSQGCFDMCGTVSFDIKGYGGSSIGGGQESIEVISLDDRLCNEDVTFIKMDIEGAELRALMGAEKIIRSSRPKLAISVYHKPEDILELPAIIMEYNPDYRLYLRHYSWSEYDTVLYAI